MFCINQSINSYIQSFEWRKRNSWHWIIIDYVQKGCTECSTWVFIYFNIEWGTLSSIVHFWGRVSNWNFLFNIAIEFVEFWRDEINLFARMVITFESIAMSQACGLEYGYSTTTFPWFSIFVFHSHDLLTELAFRHVKIQAIHCHQSRQKHIFCLLLWLLQGITKHEDSLLGCMSMDVNVDE